MELFMFVAERDGSRSCCSSNCCATKSTTCWPTQDQCWYRDQDWAPFW